MFVLKHQVYFPYRHRASVFAATVLARVLFDVRSVLDAALHKKVEGFGGTYLFGILYTTTR